MRAPIRLRRCISAASVQPDQFCDVHDVAESLCASSTIICAFCNVRFGQLDQCLHRAHGELSWVNDL